MAAAAAATAGIARLFALTVEARSDIRTTMRLGPSSGDLAWALGVARMRTASRVVFLPPAVMPSSDSAEAAPVTTVALAMADPAEAGPDQADDDLITGSLLLDAPTISQPNRMPVLSGDRAISDLTLSALPAPPPSPSSAAAKAASLVATPPVPPARLPLPRPRLASREPTTNIDIGPDDNNDRARTAIYDITAQTVYLPNGERLEAHSGLGNFMDDPRSARWKNRGVTPPNVYRLTLRETLFHGVQAIRLTPVNDEGMYGRDGILAHTYMLGPSGQSNGCVSFRNYQRFLRAFLNREIDRLVVVARLDKVPTFLARSNTHENDRMF